MKNRRDQDQMKEIVIDALLEGRRRVPSKRGRGKNLTINGQQRKGETGTEKVSLRAIHRSTISTGFQRRCIGRRDAGRSEAEGDLSENAS